MLLILERLMSRGRVCFLRRLSSTSSNVSSNETQIPAVGGGDNSIFTAGSKKKFLRVAIVGVPNVGKSTLVNRLMRRSVCPVSSKVHTTQCKVDAVYSEGDTQLVFTDTPGVVSNYEVTKYKTAGKFNSEAGTSLVRADVVGIVKDADNVFTRHKLSLSIAKLLDSVQSGTSIFLVLNKVDNIKQKEKLLPVIKKVTTDPVLPRFSEIFMVSALTGDGVDDIRNYLLQSAKFQDWEYEGKKCINQTPEQLVEDMVKAKLLDALPAELPYEIKVRLLHLEFAPAGDVSAIVKLTCKTNRILALLLRSRAKRVQTIAVRAEEELRNTFRNNVRVRLQLEVRQKPQ